LEKSAVISKHRNVRAQKWSDTERKKTEFQNHKKDSARKALSTAIRLVPTIKKYNAICSNTIVGYNNRRKSQKRQLEIDHL
jgi:hypothetical protein